MNDELTEKISYLIHPFLMSPFFFCQFKMHKAHPAKFSKVISHKHQTHFLPPELHESVFTLSDEFTVMDVSGYFCFHFVHSFSMVPFVLHIYSKMAANSFQIPIRLHYIKNRHLFPLKMYQLAFMVRNWSKKMSVSSCCCFWAHTSSPLSLFLQSIHNILSNKFLLNVSQKRKKKKRKRHLFPLQPAKFYHSTFTLRD